MIDSFVIENFRLFRRLEIARFGQVNLFVGKNNSGKSALLEALELYASNVSGLTIKDLVERRSEIWNEKIAAVWSVSIGESIRHLFRGHSLPTSEQSGILLGSLRDKSQQINIVMAPFYWAIDEGELVRKRLLPEDLDDEEIETEFELVVQDNSKYRRLARKSGDVPSRIPFQGVSTQNMAAPVIAQLWDKIGLRPLANEVINCLKVIEPTLNGILFVDSGHGRIPLASCEGAPEPFPLKSMGDGMTRLFHIIVALVNAKNGIVLIDEFENGLHWSVQPKIWNAIFRLAKQLNVQVFATTHSCDCVAGFEDAWAEYPEQGAFFRLQLNKENEPSIKSYSLETLADSLDTDVEVR